MITIKKILSKEERILLVLDILATLNKDLRLLTTQEREVVLLTRQLPIVIAGSPFSLAPKRFYAEQLKMPLSTVNRLIGQIHDKGYLEESYGEYFWKNGIQALIDLANGEADVNLSLILQKKKVEDIKNIEEIEKDANQKTHGIDQGDFPDI
jgi:hypothetical protein